MGGDIGGANLNRQYEEQKQYGNQYQLQQAPKRPYEVNKKHAYNNGAHRLKNEIDQIENANFNELRVREIDDLDDDSSGSEIGGDRDYQDDGQDNPQVAEQRMKSKMSDDWNYLKKTMNGMEGPNSGFKKAQNNKDDDYNDVQDNKYPSQELLDFHEKVDTLLEKEEELISAHMNLIKENAQLLTKEGEMISYV